MKYYENTSNGHNKWWKVYPPYLVRDGVWGVRVEFGKIGAKGQTRVHAEPTEDIAWRYYSEKLDEKRNKGYIQKQSNNVSAKLLQIQAAATRKLKKEEQEKARCTHAMLTAAGKNKWRCGSCKTVIEFGKAFDNQTREEVDETVRHIDLGGLC